MTQPPTVDPSASQAPNAAGWTPPGDSPAARMVGVNEACDQLGIGKSKFYELIRKGELTAVDINGVEKRLVGQRGPRRSLRVEQAEIDRFKAERLVRT